MTMHLLKGYSSLNTKKPKPKITKAKLNELEKEWLKDNKRLRQNHMHRDQRTFAEYIDYVYGNVKIKKEFKPYETQHEPYTRPTPNYPSASPTKKRPNASSGQRGTNPTPRKEPQRYTGTLVKGISTMHKSNAVPIINKEQATEISRMGR